MRRLHWLMHFWRLVAEKGAYCYWECRICGCRREGRRYSHIYGPKDRKWIETGMWTNEP